MIDKDTLSNMQETCAIIKEHSQENDRILNEILKEEDKAIIYFTAEITSKKLEQFFINYLISCESNNKELLLESKIQILDIVEYFLDSFKGR